MINIDKLRMMANRVQEIIHLGADHYPFERKTPILNYIDKPIVNMDLNKLKELASKLEAQATGG
jgi:hypothetical protein